MKMCVREHEKTFIAQEKGWALLGMCKVFPSKSVPIKYAVTKQIFAVYHVVKVVFDQVPLII